MTSDAADGNSRAGTGLISFVVPVLDEAGSLRQLFDELTGVVERLGREAEYIFIDDGSTDGTWRILSELHELHPRVRLIRFRRNFGKAAALAAGFEAVAGSTVVTLDADLQDDPAELPRLLAKLDEGYDLVSGWKRSRNDPWHKVYPSRVFNWMVSRLTGVDLHDHNCGFKAYRREVVEEIDLYGEFHRFTPVLAAARGFRIGETPVNHRKRVHGESKYGFERFVRGLLDMLTVKFLTDFTHRPQHLIGVFGLTLLSLGVAGLVYLSLIWLMNLAASDPAPIGSRPMLTYSATSLLFGAQLLLTGLLAELITSNQTDRRRLYSLRESREPRADYTSTTTPT